MAQTLSQRWAGLAPAVRIYGPADRRPRPAVLFFHGCGGVRPRLVESYARIAAGHGYRSFSIDSLGPRRWSRRYALTFVCTGAMFRGAERAGDVLAATWGVAARADVDPSRMLLAGWSHGAWAIMDLMTMPLARSGEAGVADPSAGPLAGVRGLFLAYPYGGVGALSRSRPWRRAPDVLGVLAARDHVTAPADARRLYRSARAAGARVEIWEASEATHAFDEEGGAGVMRHHPERARQAHSRFAALIVRTLGSA